MLVCTYDILHLVTGYRLAIASLKVVKYAVYSKCLLACSIYHLRVAGSILGHENLQRPLGKYADTVICVIDGTKQACSLVEKL